MAARKSEPDPALGDLIRRVRERQGRSREDVAYESGVAVSTVMRLEGAKGEPGWAKVRRVAATLGLTLADIGEAIEGKGGAGDGGPG